MQIEENIPLATLTTFKTGGPARFVISASAQELGDVYAFARAHELPVIPLGGGSNMLAPDQGVEAVFVRLTDGTIEAHERTLQADAGANWDDVVQEAVRHEWWGVENLSAIPGTVGGAVVQNIGAYGAALGDVLHSVTAYDTHESKTVTLSAEQCALGYRTSIFKTERDRYIVLRACLKFEPGKRDNCTYKDLATHFVGRTPEIMEVRRAVIGIRATKFPPLAEYGTAGSFFLNPVMSSVTATAVQSRYPAMPLFVLPEGGVKVPLGWFVDHRLTLRGHKEGNVEAWREQALVLVAHRGATTAEVKKFAERIVERVKKEIGIEISPEVRIL